MLCVRPGPIGDCQATLSAGSVPLLSAGTKGHSNIVDPPRLDRWVVTFVPATLAISDLMTALGKEGASMPDAGDADERGAE